MTEITMTLPRAEHLRDVLKSGNAIVQLVRDMMDGEEYADSLYGAVLILQSAYSMVDDMIEGAIKHENY